MSESTSNNGRFVYEGKVAINQTDLNGIITYVNRKFCEVTGYDRDELIGASNEILKHPDMPRSIFEKMWETISGGQAWNGVVKNKRKNNQYYWIKLEILPIKDDEHNVTGYIAVGKAPSETSIEENEELYNKMLNNQE